MIPFVLKQFPITWAAGASGFVGGGDLVVVGFDFANGDAISKIIVANGKARLTADPTLKCPVLNQTITGVTADAVGAVVQALHYGATCTVPPTSATKVTIIGSKDVQRSQIPPNDVIGTNAAKKATALIPMGGPAG